MRTRRYPVHLLREATAGPVSRRRPSDWATPSVHLTPPSSCQTLPPIAVSVLCHRSPVKRHGHTFHDGQTGKDISSPCPPGGPRLLEMSPLQRQRASTQRVGNLRGELEPQETRGEERAGHSRVVCYPTATQRTGNTQRSCWGHSDFYQEILLLIQPTHLHTACSQKAEGMSVSEYQCFT